MRLEGKVRKEHVTRYSEFVMNGALFHTRGVLTMICIGVTCMRRTMSARTPTYSTSSSTPPAEADSLVRTQTVFSLVI